MYKLIVCVVLISSIFANTATFINSSPEKMSEALGHRIGKNLQALKIPIDIDAIAKGLQDENYGFSSPMTDEECIEPIRIFQKEKNLIEANAFLEHNRTKKGVFVLADGKLQFEILKKGIGESVQSYNSPLIRLKKGVDGNAPCETEQIIALDEAIEGLKIGIVGMFEGEIRKLYIHPTLGQVKQNPFTSPESLLILEIEVLKADASPDAHAASNSGCLPIFQDLDDVSPRIR